LATNPVRVKLDTKKLDLLASTVAMEAKLALLVDVGGRKVEARAKQIIVEKKIVDTGATLNSTQSRTVPGERLARRIGPTTDYAVHLEFGTSRMPARPFMIPALEEERDPFIAAVRAIYA
tara:strand:+ start:8649 stop:9008 length:360 start_codon:yes stop_codon:yes gene_type:complete